MANRLENGTFRMLQFTARWNGVYGLLQGHAFTHTPHPEPYRLPTLMAVQVFMLFGHFSYPLTISLSPSLIEWEGHSRAHF